MPERKSRASPLQSFLAIKRQELPLALLMFGYFFLVITAFWVLKPIKKALFFDFYRQSEFSLLGWQLTAAQAEQLAKVLNMVVALLAVTGFTWLSRRMRRQQLSYASSLFCGGCLLVFAWLLRQPNALSVWSLYLFGDLFNTLMVATFFAFLNDSFSPEVAKRTYGPIILGGVGGGAFGSLFVKLQIERLSTSQWMSICLGMVAAIMALARAAGARVNRNPPPQDPDGDSGAKTGNAALEGAKLVAQSPYLLSIVTIVGIYELMSTILDFQFSATVAQLADGSSGAYFSTVYLITNCVSLAIQLFLTSFVMNLLGVGSALVIMPAAIVLASAGYLTAPMLWTGNLLSISDNGLNYSLNQSAREALYTPTTRNEKYKAKAFIDMFVQRAAKAVAVGLTLAVTTAFTSFESIRWLSLFTLAGGTLWIIAARYAGERFAALTGDKPG